MKQQAKYLRLLITAYFLNKRVKRITRRMQVANIHFKSLSADYRPLAYPRLEAIEQESAMLVRRHVEIISEMESYKVDVMRRLGSISQRALLRQLHLFDGLKTKTASTLDVLKETRKEFNRSWA